MWTSNAVKAIKRLECRVDEELGAIWRRLLRMTQEVDDVKVAVGSLLDAVPSALQLIQDEVAAILAAKGGSALSDAEKASLEASAKSISDTAASITKAVGDAKAALAPAPADAPADAPASGDAGTASAG